MLCGKVLVTGGHDHGSILPVPDYRLKGRDEVHDVEV
jgi:hypothetical protein